MQIQVENPVTISLKDAIRQALQSMTLIGAEEGQEPDPQSGEGQEPDPSSEEKEEDESDSGSTIPASEARRLRNEAAKWRNEFRAVQSKLSEIEQKDMSELEKLRAQVETLTEENSNLTSRLVTRERDSLIQGIAASLKFNDPRDAIGLLPSDISVDEETGLPTERAIKGALEKIAKEKPYLVTPVSPPAPGSADGGTNGQEPISADKQAQLEKKAQEELAGAGGVTVPW